ncbi:MAG: TIGR03936 family radical SAM-associated protein [Phycisphaerae bacterium]|nr:TIGR03936 family radical SAM-associated protein [Phycisphaerae bacterium]
MVKFTVDGDLRFISHHDTMRMIERLSHRAKLPFRYTQGFNPRAIISLPSPRPVGVASRDDRMVITLDAPMESQDILQQLNSCTIPGLNFISAVPLDKKQPATPTQIDHELPLTPQESSAVKAKVDKLNASNEWLVERNVKSRRQRGRGKNRNDNTPRTKSIDIHIRISDMRVENSTLHFSCVPKDEVWARPGELLGLLDIPTEEGLSRLVRTKLL